MEKLLKLENVKIIDTCDNYENAIDMAIKPLVEGKFCKESYLEKVKKNHKKLGPYYVLGDHLALIHAENEGSVNESQISLALVKKGVNFSDDHQNIQIIIGLCAKNNSDHLSVMANIANIFTNEKLINNLLNCCDEKQLYECFIKGGNKV